MATIDKVKEVVSKQLNKPIEKIGDDMDLVKDLGADSLDIVEMMMSFEEEGITISEEDARGVKTVADVAKLIDKK